jgi:hypothetical protein
MERNIYATKSDFFKKGAKKVHLLKNVRALRAYYCEKTVKKEIWR